MFYPGVKRGHSMMLNTSPFVAVLCVDVCLLFPRCLHGMMKSGLNTIGEIYFMKFFVEVWPFFI
jgi:hypothetical protein